jgi:2-amino-4-hydroxy-6-hydroxymethyldihydropteridine diphosphokinase
MKIKSNKGEDMSRITVYLSLGSNLGDREKNILTAIRLISSMEGFETIELSPIYVTEPVDMEPESPSFLNMVIKGEFIYTPAELLANIEKIESELGRTEKGKKKPRTIDIDILLFGDTILKNDNLAIPHKLMTERAFVLGPLLQIAPDLIHPGSKKRFDSYLSKKEIDNLILYKELDKTHV